MFSMDDNNQRLIKEALDSLNELNMSIIDYESSNYSIKKTLINHFFKYLKKCDFKHIVKRVRVRRNIKRLPTDVNCSFNKGSKYNYFNNKRIAVYTALFGAYDKLNDPVFVPNNCDFFIVSDNDYHGRSQIWRSINADKYLPDNITLSNPDKNRFFKMHPHLLFAEYDYSIYVDSNILVVNDLTPFVNMIANYGMGFHSHRARDCVYSEAKAAEMLGKMNRFEYSKYISYLNNIKMPKHYGLLECNVIARNHNDSNCIEIMEEWWDMYFRLGIKRDQLWLPVVLRKHNIDVSRISSLGGDVYKQPLLRVLYHN